MKNKETTKKINIIENATILYSEGNIEQFEAIRITEKGVQIGKIIDKKFEPFGFIPNHSIKEIIKDKKKRKKVLVR